MRRILKQDHCTVIGATHLQVISTGRFLRLEVNYWIVGTNRLARLPRCNGAKSGLHVESPGNFRHAYETIHGTACVAFVCIGPLIPALRSRRKRVNHFQRTNPEFFRHNQTAG